MLPTEAMLKHFPGEDRDTGEPWMREEERREKRRGAGARGATCAPAPGLGEAPGRRQPAENGGGAAPGPPRAAASGASQSSSCSPPGQVGASNSGYSLGPCVSVDPASLSSQASQ